MTFTDRDGLYSFEEEQELDDEIPGIGHYTYWSQTYASGLYDDPIAAEREAKVAIAWLIDMEFNWSSNP